VEDFLKKIRDDHHDFDKNKLEDYYPSNPIDFFHDWYKEAFEVKENEPNAMVLSTVNKDNKPSSRILYLKELNHNGFVFFSNYASQKGKDLSENPFASLLFFWPTLQRQVRIEGQITKTPSIVSEEYFATRPKESQLGAWASNQSQFLEDRAELERRFEEMIKKFPKNVPCPPHWGGYQLAPNKVEFWQGRPSRLHDRIVYEKGIDWKIYRLNP
jgi:pyridoxamine 5'-phosphate oxidase